MAPVSIKEAFVNPCPGHCVQPSAGHLSPTQLITPYLIWLDICCVICLIVADGGVYSLSVQLTTRETTYRCVFSTLMRKFLPNANVH